jgi:hypothetical protein
MWRLSRISIKSNSTTKQAVDCIHRLLKFKEVVEMITAKRMNIMGIIALFLVNFGYMADMVIIPAAHEIYNEFSAEPVGLLNFILTGPQLIDVASALLVTVFMRHFSKKNIRVV